MKNENDNISIDQAKHIYTAGSVVFDARRGETRAKADYSNFAHSCLVGGIG